MDTYRLQLKIRSPLVTPLQGDTLFGHLCWGIAYHEGENALTDFLSSYDNTPPLVISNGFPHDKLPMPILSPYVPEHADKEKIEELKHLKKQRFVPRELFFNDSFRFSTETLLVKFSKQEFGKKENDEKQFTKTQHMHNTINRISGMVESGGLYAIEEHFPPKGKDTMDIYLASTLPEKRIETLFQWALENGYGADKSTGKGAIAIHLLEKAQFPENGNRLMSLGNFIPGPNDKLKRLRADVMTKFGKLGGHFVTSRNPFKKPLLMYKAGSTFEMENPTPVVGLLLSNIHKDPEIRHHAYAPLIRYHEEVPQ